MLRDLHQKGSLLLVVKIGGLDRAAYARCNCFDAPRFVGSKFAVRSFLLLVNLTGCKFREHLIAFVPDQQSLSRIADDDEIAILYLHVHDRALHDITQLNSRELKSSQDRSNSARPSSR